MKFFPKILTPKRPNCNMHICRWWETSVQNFIYVQCIGFWVLVFTKYDSQNLRIFMGKWSFSPKYQSLKDRIAICTSADGKKQVWKIWAVYNIYVLSFSVHKVQFSKSANFMEKWSFPPKYWPLWNQITICTSADDEKQVCKISDVYNV